MAIRKVPGRAQRARRAIRKVPGRVPRKAPGRVPGPNPNPNRLRDQRRHQRRVAAGMPLPPPQDVPDEPVFDKSVAPRVLGNPDLAHKIAGFLTNRRNRVRFGVVSRAARDAQRRLPAHDPIFQPVDSVRIAELRPEQRATVRLTYNDTQHKYVEALPDTWFARYPSKASLLALLRSVESRSRPGIYAGTRFAPVLKKVVNSAALGLLDNDTARELIRFVIESRVLLSRYPNDRQARHAAYFDHASRLSYHALYIVMVCTAMFTTVLV